MDELSIQRTEVLAEQGEVWLPFFLLSVLLFLTFFRPGDLFPWSYVLHLPMVVAILCLLSYVLLGSSKARRLFTLSPAIKMLGLISLWALATLPLAFYITGSLNIFYDYWARLVILTLLLGNVVRSVKQLRQIIWLCMLCIAAVSLIAVALRAIYGPGSPSGRLEAYMNGPYSGSNYLAITVLLALPFSLMFLLIHPRKLVRVVCAGLTGIYILATLLTQSRAGAIAMLVIVVGVVWKLRDWGKRPAVIVLMILPGLLLCFLLVGKGLVERFSTVVMDYDLGARDVRDPLRMAAGSYRERRELLFQTIHITMENPIVGVGMGNYSPAHANEFSTGSGQDWLHCHNTYLQFSSELGIPGLLMYLLMLWLTFRSLHRTKQRLRGMMEKRQELQQLALLADATTVALYGYLISSAFASVAYNCYFFVLVGLAEAITQIAVRIPMPLEGQHPEGPVHWPEFAGIHSRVAE